MRFADPSNPAAWLISSFLLILLATNLTWLVVRHSAFELTSRRGRFGALGWLVLALFYLLPPTFGLREGVLSFATLGLTETDWPTTLSSGLTLAGIVVGGIIFGWLLYRRSLPEGPRPESLARLLSALRAPVEAVLHQLHWAFYRATAVGWLLMTPLRSPDSPLLVRLMDTFHAQPLYWGAWLGLAVAGLELVFNPFSRAALCRSGDQQTLVRRAALAVATTGLFVMTRNLWLCLIVHIAVEMLAAGWFPLPVGPSAIQEG